MLNFKIGADVDDLLVGTAKAEKAVSRLGDTIETLRAKLLAKKEFVTVEKDIGKIAILNTEIRALQAEITRIQTQGKAGFLDFGNAAENASTSIVSGAGKAYSALRQVAYVLPGIGIGGIVAFAGSAIANLLGIGSASSATSVDIRTLTLELGELKTSTEKADEAFKNLKRSLDIQNEINKINLKIEFPKAPGTQSFLGLVGDLNAAMIERDQIKKNLNASTGGLDLFFGGESFILSSKKAKQAIADFAQFGDAAADDLNKTDKKIFEEYKQRNENIKKYNQELLVAEDNITKIKAEQSLAVFDIERDKNKKADKERKKALQELKQALQEEAQLRKFFVDVIHSLEKEGGPLPNTPRALFPIEDALQDAVNKGLVQLKPDAVALEQMGSTVAGSMVAAIILKYGEEFKKLGKLLPKLTAEQLTSLPPSAIEAKFSNKLEFEKAKKELIGLKSVAEGVANAFGDVFNSISQGKNVFKAVGEAIKQLILDLIRAALQAFVFNSILGLFTGGGSLAISSFTGGKVPHFATGGLVFGKTLGVIGEGQGTSHSNPEVVAPLDKLKSMLNGMGGQNVTVGGRFIIQGKDLALVLSRNNSSDLRTT